MIDIYLETKGGGNQICRDVIYDDPEEILGAKYSHDVNTGPFCYLGHDMA